MSAKFKGFSEPKANYSKLPHQLIDALPLFSSKAELAVVLYILRHTWGYHDSEKKITLDEFEYGRKDRNGQRMDSGVGMSRHSVITGLRDAETHGFIAVFTDDSDKGRVKKFYSLVTEEGLKSCTPEVKELHPRGKELSPRSEKDTIGEIPEKEKKEKDIASGASADGSPAKKKENPLYDAVLEVFGIAGALNGLMCGMLNGTSKKKGYSEANLPTPVSPTELRAWARWYKYQNTDPRTGDFVMVKSPLKVQSSILAFRQIPQVKVVPLDPEPQPPVTPPAPAALDPDERVYLTTDQLRDFKAKGMLAPDFDETRQLTPFELMEHFIIKGGTHYVSRKKT